MNNLTVEAISKMILPLATALNVDIKVYPTSELFMDATDSVAVEVGDQVYLITDDSGTCLFEVVPTDFENVDADVSEIEDVEAGVGRIVAAALRA